MVAPAMYETTLESIPGTLYSVIHFGDYRSLTRPLVGSEAGNHQCDICHDTAAHRMYDVFGESGCVKWYACDDCLEEYLCL